MTMTFRIMPTVSLWGSVRSVQLDFPKLCIQCSWNKRILFTPSISTADFFLFLVDESITEISLLNM